MYFVISVTGVIHSCSAMVSVFIVIELKNVNHGSPVLIGNRLITVKGGMLFTLWCDFPKKPRDGT